MSKKPLNTEPMIGWQSGYIIQDYMLSNLEGRILTFIESLGFTDTRERAVKAILRQEVWALFSNSDALFVSPEDHTRLRNEFYKNKHSGSADFPGNAPVSTFVN